MDERELVSRCQHDDAAAFEELFRLYQDHAVRTAYLVTGRRHLAEEVAQEAFVQTFRHIKELRRPEDFRLWLYRTLLRIGRRMASRERQHLPFDTALAEQGPLETGPTPEEALESQYVREEVWKAVEKLGEVLRSVVVLHYFNQFTVQEIAEITGCAVGTVKSRLHTARLRLEGELRRSLELPNRPELLAKGNKELARSPH